MSQAATTPAAQVTVSNNARNCSLVWLFLNNVQLAAGLRMSCILSSFLVFSHWMSRPQTMTSFIVAFFAFALVLPLYAVPVTRTSSTDTLIYDAVVVGTNEVVELMPALTGLPSPITVLTNVDIGTCASGEICVAEAFTDTASHVASSVVAEFRVLPASIVTALEDIVEAIDAGIEVDRFASNTMNSGLLVSLTSASTRQGGTTGSVSASEGSSSRSAVSAGTPSTQNASPDVVSNPSMSATTSVNSPGTWLRYQRVTALRAIVLQQTHTILLSIWQGLCQSRTRG